MNNYRIITDEAKFKDFIDWLPLTSIHEIFYVCLFSRSKYCNTSGVKHIKTDKQQVKRFIATKQNLFYKVKQLEVPLDSYRQRELPIPQESLALYINPNPRSMIKATYKAIHKLVDLTMEQYTSNRFNLNHEILSTIQTSKGQMYYMDFDFDNISLSRLLQLISPMINLSAVEILQTKNGFHLLVNIEKVDNIHKKSWYTSLNNLVEIDVTGDQMIPIPGTIQGMFTPKFINLNDYLINNINTNE